MNQNYRRHGRAGLDRRFGGIDVEEKFLAVYLSVGDIMLHLGSGVAAREALAADGGSQGATDQNHPQW